MFLGYTSSTNGASVTASYSIPAFRRRAWAASAPTGRTPSTSSPTRWPTPWALMPTQARSAASASRLSRPIPPPAFRLRPSPPHSRRRNSKSPSLTPTRTGSRHQHPKTISSTNVVVTGPHRLQSGCTSSTPCRPTGFSNGTPRTVTYQVMPADGTWTVGDNGVYTISVLANLRAKRRRRMAVPAGRPSGPSRWTWPATPHTPTASSTALNITAASSLPHPDHYRHLLRRVAVGFGHARVGQHLGVPLAQWVQTGVVHVRRAAAGPGRRVPARRGLLLAAWPRAGPAISTAPTTSSPTPTR